MMENFFWPEMAGMDSRNMWFQQDGATCYTSHQAINLLKTKFGNRIISRNGPTNWSVRSCDLTTCDFFLWGFLKDRVYANAPQTTEALKKYILDNIRLIIPEMCLKVIKNCNQRLIVCRAGMGAHMPEIIFHV